MSRSWLAVMVTFHVVCSLVSVAAQAAPLEPTPETVFRPLRDDAVKTWYIYNDRNLNGILDPGDEKVAEVKNWWTPVSAHTQYNYAKRTLADGQDWAAAPLNMASKTDPTDNYWLPRVDNAIQFYMTYSQFDNNDWFGGYDYGQTDPTVKAILKQRNEYRNGWALGWLTHGLDLQATQTPAGSVEMDVFVHNGQAVTAPVDVPEWGPTWGTGSYSDPQVAASNDISPKAEDTVGASLQWHPPQFDGVAGGYTWLANQTRMDANGLDASDLNDIVNSMEVREHAPDSLGATDVICGPRRPAEIAAGLTDHDDSPYLYEDAFLGRSLYHEGTNDGGVIAGLAGQSDYDLEINNWGDQQVIRIDISPETLASGDPELAGNITQVIFYDFGDMGTGDQVNPVPIVLDLLGMEPDPLNPGQFREKFPEYRFYIAATEIVPEPGALTLIVLGGLGMVLRRRR